MPGKSRYLMIVSMDVDPEHEAPFNEVYDKEHIPNLSRVPGVLGIARYKREELIMNIGGERKMMRAENEPAYSAIYELESPDVLTSPEWSEAVEAGRWPSQVRPYTRNRRHILLKMTSHGE
jgi:hypothetical protein